MLKRLLSIGSRFCPGRQRRNPPNRTIVLIVAPRAMTNRLSARTGSRGIVRIVARLTRGLRLGLVAAVMAFVLGACHFDGGGVELSALNESDHAVVLNVVAEQTRTFVLPAHSYAGLYGTWTRLSPTWHVRVFDDSCHLIVDQQITVTSGVLHVAADGTIAWKRDTGGATGSRPCRSPLQPIARARSVVLTRPRLRPQLLTIQRSVDAWRGAITRPEVQLPSRSNSLRLGLPIRSATPTPDFAFPWLRFGLSRVGSSDSLLSVARRTGRCRDQLCTTISVAANRLIAKRSAASILGGHPLKTNS